MFISTSVIASLIQFVITVELGVQGHPQQPTKQSPQGSYHRASCDFVDEIVGQRTLYDTHDYQRQSPLWDHSGRNSAGSVPAPQLELIPLGLSGSADNRVDLVFFSDGYLSSERAKFIADATRLADDVSKNQTFYTVKPLLNFWAAFSPSKESGIGVGGVPKDTVYGLYRQGTQLRGVYYSKPEVARAACASLGSQCDYPILLANDPLYGGLGGEFTVITSSYLNGPLVLRHELGHSIIEVGEEYDGGFAYCGVNAAHESERTSGLPWKQWLTEQPLAKEAATSSNGSSLSQPPSAPRVERSIMPFQSYPWTMLKARSPWIAEFTSSGEYSRYLVKFSLSGVPEKSNLRVELDGVDLGWAPEPLVGVDRWHYDIFVSEKLAPGPHELRFALQDSKLEGISQLCSVEVLEFGDESEFNSTPGHYSLYPTFSLSNETSYRPTNQDCLMRAVVKPNFCKACMETLWLQLLKRVHLIEGLNESCNAHGTKTLALDLVPLAHLRTGDERAVAEISNESYTITWTKDSKLLEKHTNQTSIHLNKTDSVGKYTVQVKFATDAVRLTDSSALVDTLEHQISSPCPHA